jgi:hypothetical protein
MKQETSGDVKSVLIEIARRHSGILKPEVVVSVAREPSSVLHSYFEWNNSKAADAYRLEQARQLIRVNVTVIGENPDTRNIYVSLSTDRISGGGYRVLADVLKDDDLRRVLLSDSVREMEHFIKKYNNLKELSRVIDTMKNVVVTLKH